MDGGVLSRSVQRLAKESHSDRGGGRREVEAGVGSERVGTRKAVMEVKEVEAAGNGEKGDDKGAMSACSRTSVWPMREVRQTSADSRL